MWLLGLVGRLRRRGTAPAAQPGTTAPPGAVVVPVPVPDAPAAVTPVTPAPVAPQTPAAPVDPRASTRPSDVIGFLSDAIRDTGQTVRLILLLACGAGIGYLLLHSVHLHGLTAGVAVALIGSATSIATALIRGRGGRADEPAPPAAPPDPATPPTGDDRPDD